MKWNNIHIVIFFSLFLIILLLSFCDNRKLSNPFDPASDSFIPMTQGLLIDDFDDGQDPNLLGFCPSEFEGNGGIIEISYHNQRKDVLRGVGSSIQIRFDVSKTDSALAGWVQPLVDTCPGESLTTSFNLETLGVRTLTFWIKAETPEINMEVALKDTNNTQTDPKKLLWSNLKLEWSYLKPDTSWRKVGIPIDDFTIAKGKPPVNLTILREMNFGFGRDHFEVEGGALTGTLYIDEIAFER